MSLNIHAVTSLEVWRKTEVFSHIALWKLSDQSRSRGQFARIFALGIRIAHGQDVRGLLGCFDPKAGFCIPS